jgi:hypothetical protein
MGVEKDVDAGGFDEKELIDGWDLGLGIGRSACGK